MANQEQSVDLFTLSLQGIGTFLPLLITLALVIAGLLLADRFLRARWREQPEAQFRLQLIMLVLTLCGGIAVLVALPVSDALRAQLLSLLGILLSAAIALSSTTFIGNVMAGIMLKTIRSARPGDFVYLGDLTGRVTEMDLLHTEVQTEFRDLVTIPNLLMVTQPLKVVRASGTIVSAEVSLGYDVPRVRVFELLKSAAEKAGLKDCFVHVRELGDMSVVYRVAGLLEDIQSLISARSALRAAMLDELHDAGIEIVSPNFMNTRAVDPERPVIPTATWRARAGDDGSLAEAIVFDKAEEAASIEQLKKAIAAVESDLSALEKADSGTVAPIPKTMLQARRAWLKERLAEADKRRKENPD